MEKSDGPRWDLSAMTSAYCNLAKAIATRDAVSISLGVVGADGRSELKPQLLHLIHLSPLTAKHLHDYLGRLLGEYEAQRGGRS